jgi:glycerophosphoryl diester phosphodiesterase
MIVHFGALERSQILSFDTKMIQEVLNLREGFSPVYLKTVHLYNFYDHIPLPTDPQEWIKNDTISISAANATQEVVDFCHQNGTKVAVWIDLESKNVIEGPEYYKNMLQIEADYIISDFPLEAKAKIEEIRITL